MSTVQIDWYHSQRDLDDALQEFAEYWDDQPFEVNYSHETDYTGRELIVATITSPMPMRQFEAMVEGTSNAAGLIDILDDYTSSGSGVSYQYL